MSTLKTINIVHPSSTNTNIVLDANGNANVFGTINATAMFVNGVAVASGSVLANTSGVSFAGDLYFPTGNVGIGTSNPVYKLDVNGSLNVSSGGAIAGGFTVASFNAGSNIAAYGTWTPNAANGNYQYVTSNGAVTVAVPATNTAIDVLWYNGRRPGSVTFTGYQAAAGGGGDEYTATANNEYLLSIRRINGLSTYVWKALQ